MPEEEAFCVFVRLMQEYRLRELFKPSMAELGLCIYQFEYMLQVRCPTSGVASCFSTEGQQNTRVHGVGFLIRRSRHPAAFLSP